MDWRSSGSCSQGVEGHPSGRCWWKRLFLFGAFGTTSFTGQIPPLYSLMLGRQTLGWTLGSGLPPCQLPQRCPHAPPKSPHRSSMPSLSPLVPTPLSGPPPACGPQHAAHQPAAQTDCPGDQPETHSAHRELTRTQPFAVHPGSLHLSPPNPRLGTGGGGLLHLVLSPPPPDAPLPA